MNNNGNNNELKLRDAPLSSGGQEKKSGGSELKLNDAPSAKPPPLVVEKTSPVPVSSVVDDREISVPETGKQGSVFLIIIQIIIMIVSVAAIIIAGYFIYKNLSPDTLPSSPPSANKK